LTGKKFASLCGVLFVLLIGCGKKAPPVPWQSIVPKRIVDLQAVSRENRLILQWTAPRENTDGSPLTDLSSFRILRSEGDLVGGECKGCGGAPQVVYDMKLDPKEQVTGKKMSFAFGDLHPGKVYVFQVVSVNGRGYPGSPSNPAQVYWDEAPPRPSLVSAERGDRRVELAWESVPGTTGYNVYRRTEAEPFPFSPLNRELLTESRFTDLTVANEQRYIYTVRSVRRVVKTDVEGTGSLELPVSPTDLIPPAPPQGLVAVPLKNGMELNWRRSPEPDLLGYYVYRRRAGEPEMKRLTPDPISKETFLDTDVEVGQEYEYAVTAVDKSPNKNESRLSEETRVKNIY
jgi:uncharacterized protein